MSDCNYDKKYYKNKVLELNKKRNNELNNLSNEYIRNKISLEFYLININKIISKHEDEINKLIYHVINRI